jgi:hypothetical protein
VVYLFWSSPRIVGLTLKLPVFRHEEWLKTLDDLRVLILVMGDEPPEIGEPVSQLLRVCPTKCHNDGVERRVIPDLYSQIVFFELVLIVGKREVFPSVPALSIQSEVGVRSWRVSNVALRLEKRLIGCGAIVGTEDLRLLRNRLAAGDPNADGLYP